MKLCVVLALMGAANAGWSHGWNSVSEMTYADFGYTLLTDDQAKFAVSKYKIISLEKCTGSAQHVLTEKGIYQTARQLKAIDPTVKVVYYLATDLGGLRCYAANATFAKHKGKFLIAVQDPSLMFAISTAEWWLKDDNGKYLKYPSIDWSNAAARDWWTSLPLLGDGNGTFEGTPTSELIDGVLADGATFVRAPNISVARREALTDAKFKMVGQLQDIITKANGGVVMANGISMYGASADDPRITPDDHNLGLLGHSDGILDEHIAVFEQVEKKNASLRVQLVADNLVAIEKAAAMKNGRWDWTIGPCFVDCFVAPNQLNVPPAPLQMSIRSILTDPH
jgi:hypothetical protein